MACSSLPILYEIRKIQQSAILQESIEANLARERGLNGMREFLDSKEGRKQFGRFEFAQDKYSNGVTTSFPHGLQIPGGDIDIKDIKNEMIDITLNIKRELKEELNLNLDDIKYKIEFIEYPSQTRNAYGFTLM